MLLHNSKRIIIKVKADKPQRQNEEDRPTVLAGMTPNKFRNAKFRKSKHLVMSPSWGLGTKTNR
jgi:hypothetical protein